MLPATGNPTELKTALISARPAALVLLAAAWLSDHAGNRGLYALAFVSGLTDVDADHPVQPAPVRARAPELVATVTALGIAMLANPASSLGLAA